METLSLLAPAKINYLLDVIRKRPDGYHDLRMIMQRVNLCDEIKITTTESSVINVACNSQDTPDGTGNIAWKAARSILDFAKSAKGVRIDIIKNIPVAAGLGGGSSDAATVLMGINKLLKLGLTEQILMKIGCNLGADVPFFIFKRAAIAEGIGDRLTPLLEMPKCWVLLVNPGIHVSTAWAYQSLQLTKTKELNTISRFFKSTNDIISVLSNDLESVTISAFPVISDIKKSLIKYGAVGSMMSGSGPTVFGLFNTFDDAESARHRITRDKDWFAATVETL